MDILKLVKEILIEQDPQEKDHLLEELSQILEHFDDLNEADVIEAVQLLLPAALQEDDKMVREAFFNAMTTAVIHYSTIDDRIDWDELAASLSSLEKYDLEYALDLLGSSGQIRYLPILNAYARDADPEIREWAEDAIKEVEYRVAHASPTQKAG